LAARVPADRTAAVMLAACLALTAFGFGIGGYALGRRHRTAIEALTALPRVLERRARLPPAAGPQRQARLGQRLELRGRGRRRCPAAASDGRPPVSDAHVVTWPGSGAHVLPRVGDVELLLMDTLVAARRQKRVVVCEPLARPACARSARRPTPRPGA
jgi:hypothetical protein